MSVRDTFIQVGQYSINVENIDYIEHSEEFGTVLHFSSGQTLQLGEQTSKLFWTEWEQMKGVESNEE